MNNQKINNQKNNPKTTTKKKQNYNKKNNGQIIIKKYANRRLYNTHSSNYVTLDDVANMVRQEHDFIVHDAKSDEDITCSILTQIILEEQNKGGQNILPASFLKQIIRFYGEQINYLLLPHYLEISLEAFKQNQKRMQTQSQDVSSAMFNNNNLSKVNKKNNEWMQTALRSFNPFMPQQNNEQTNNKHQNPQQDTTVEDLKKQIENMQTLLESLRKD